MLPPSKIEIGKTYCNSGSGRTTRTVLDIRYGLTVNWLSLTARPTEPVVRYVQNGTEKTLYLSSFARWCGAEVLSR